MHFILFHFLLASSLYSSSQENAFFFAKSKRNSDVETPRAIYRMEGTTTCCVIKPHAVKSHLTGEIVSAIEDAGFHVTALQNFQLKYEHAEEFFEIYKGVVQDYTVNNLLSFRSRKKRHE